MTIQPGMIGVNTADDTGRLCVVVGHAHTGETVTLRPLNPPYGDKTIPAANFWPLLSKLNLEG